MNILFCTDGTNISNQAIKNFSLWSKDNVTDILCAADWSFLPENVIIDDERFNTFCTNSVNGIIQEAEMYLRDNNIELGKSIKMCGDSVDCILDTLKEKEYDCIVMGSHSKHGIDKWLGSVSQEVAALSDVSTYVSKEKVKNKNIAFLIDHTKASSEIIEKAAKLIDLNDKNIFLLNIYEFPNYLFSERNFDKSWISDIEKRQENFGQLLLSKVSKKLEMITSKITQTVIKKNTIDDILKFFTEKDIDLVVCSSNNTHKKYKFLFNPMNKRILELAKADVLIVK